MANRTYGLSPTPRKAPGVDWRLPTLTHDSVDRPVGLTTASFASFSVCLSSRLIMTDFIFVHSLPGPDNSC